MAQYTYGPGFFAYAYYNESADFATPSWIEIPLVREATLNNSNSDLDASTRGGRGVMHHEQGLLDHTIDFTALWVPGDGPIGAVQAAWLGRNLIDMWFNDQEQAVVGSSGVRAEFKVLSFNRGEPLDDMMTVDISVAVTRSANAPEWKVVT